MTPHFPAQALDSFSCRADPAHLGHCSGYRLRFPKPHGRSWRRTTTVRATGWLPGSYLVELTAGGKGHYIPLTVRSPGFAYRLVLVSETTTYQAYNQWGGYSLYQGPGGSFGDRPTRSATTGRMTATAR